MYSLFLLKKAQHQLKHLPNPQKRAIIDALEDLQDETILLGKPLTKELTGRLTYKVGVYRIIYRVDLQNRVIQVLRIGHRGEVYS